MPVPPAVVRGKEVTQRGQQILVAPRTCLDDGYAGRRVRQPDMQQAVPAVGDVVEEPGTIRGQVANRLRIAGADVDEPSLHATRNTGTPARGRCRPRPPPR